MWLLAKRLSACLLSLIVLLPLMWLSSTAQAQEDKKVDVRLVIDISGSMKKNDPQNLRSPAVELMTKMVPPDAKAGVWTFGKQVNMLVPHKPVTEQWRKMAARKAQAINSVGLYTNIGEALEKSLYDLERLKPDTDTSVILLTDGMVDIAKDPAKNQQAKDALLEQWLPKAKAAGVVIHTIALSDNADAKLMERLALETDGMAATANSADELMSLFLRALDDAAPSEQVPLEENNFLIDSSIEEFTALIFHDPEAAASRLRGPDASTYQANKARSDLNWFAADTYDLVTIKQPLEGEWKILADPHSDTRVNVISDLSLKVNRLPKNIFPGNVPNLIASLMSEDGIIKDEKFLRLIDISVVVKALDEDKLWRKSLSRENPAPADGKFLADISMLQQEGRYQVAIKVDGKSFQREKQQLISVKNPFAFEAKADDEGLVFEVYGRDSDVDYASLKVQLNMITPNGDSQLLTLEPADPRSWQGYQEVIAPGLYQVQALVVGSYSDGSPVNLKLDKRDVYFNTTPEQEQAKQAAMEAAAKPEPQKAPEPEVKEEPEVIEEEELEEADEGSEEEFDEEELAEPEPEESNWLLYAAVIVGNLVLAAIGFFAYRLIMGGGKKEEDEEEAFDPEIDDLPESEGQAEDAAAEEAAEEAPIEQDEILSLEDEAGDDFSADVIDLGGDDEDEMLAPLDMDDSAVAESDPVESAPSESTAEDEEPAMIEEPVEQDEAVEEEPVVEEASVVEEPVAEEPVVEEPKPSISLDEFEEDFVIGDDEPEATAVDDLAATDAAAENKEPDDAAADPLADDFAIEEDMLGEVEPLPEEVAETETPAPAEEAAADDVDALLAEVAEQTGEAPEEAAQEPESSTQGSVDTDDIDALLNAVNEENKQD